MTDHNWDPGVFFASTELMHIEAVSDLRSDDGAVAIRLLLKVDPVCWNDRGGRDFLIRVPDGAALVRRHVIQGGRVGPQTDASGLPSPGTPNDLGSHTGRGGGISGGVCSVDRMLPVTKDCASSGPKS